jgi:hypothetical protein
MQGDEKRAEGSDANGPLDVTQARALLNDPDRVAEVDTQAFGKRLADILRRALRPSDSGRMRRRNTR